jgi:hypothetical protein
MIHVEYDVEMTSDRNRLTDLLKQGFDYVCEFGGMKVVRRETEESWEKRMREIREKKFLEGTSSPSSPRMPLAEPLP